MTCLKIQSRFKQQITRRKCRVFLLHQYWDKMVAHIQKIGAKLRDANVLKLNIKFQMVPSEVKDELFKEYINACKDQYAAAFLQWRLKFPRPKEHNWDPEILEETI